MIGVPQIVRYNVDESRDDEVTAASARNDPVPSEAEPSPYATLVRPRSPSRVAGARHIEESRLLDTTDEGDRLRERLDALADRVCDATYSGLREWQLTTAMSRCEHPVAGSVVSRAADRITDRIDLDDVIAGISRSAPADHDDPSALVVEDGADWDVGFTAFVGRVFLDDLRLSSEFLESYEHSALDGETDASLRHALGLEEGYYVRRRRVSDLESRDDRSFLDNSDDRIRERMLADCVETVDPGREGRSASE